MRCPVCDTERDPATQVGQIAICAACGRSLARRPDGEWRLTIALDIDRLSPSDRATLVRARSSIARGERRRVR